MGGTKVLLVPDPPTAAAAAAAATAGDAALGFPAVFDKFGDDDVGEDAADITAATTDARVGKALSSSSSFPFSPRIFSAKSTSVTTCAFSPWRGSNGSTVRWSIFFSLMLDDFSPKMHTNKLKESKNNEIWSTAIDCL